MIRSTTIVLALGSMFVAPIASHASLSSPRPPGPTIMPRGSSLVPFGGRTSSLPAPNLNKPLPARPIPPAFKPSSSYRGGGGGPISFGEKTEDEDNGERR